MGRRIQTALDQDAVDAFWRFVYERQMAWHRMIVEHAEPPWTDDDIIANYYFTNVYRELDPGTQYVIQDILDRDAPAQDKLFNTIIYRLIGRKETHEHLGFQSTEEFAPETFIRAMNQRRDAGKPVFTGAYLVSGYGSGDKVESIASIFTDIRNNIGAVTQNIQQADRLQDAYNQLIQLPGLGNFLAYQICVDLLYPLSCYNYDAFLPFTPNDWAAAGPGAQKGIALLAPDAGTTDHLPVMRHLHNMQENAFDQRHLTFPYICNYAGSTLPLSLANIQNCLCEYHKYEKIKDNPRRARRTFEPNKADIEALRHQYRDAPNISL